MKERVEETIGDAVRQTIGRDLEYCDKQIGDALQMRATFANHRASSVPIFPGEVRLGWWLPGRLEFTFDPALSRERMSEILRAFVRLSGVKLTKRFQEAGGTFEATGQMECGDRLVTIRFTDFVPPQCVVEEVEELVPAHWEPETTKKSFKVVCNPPEVESDDIDGAEVNGAEVEAEWDREV